LLKTDSTKAVTTAITLLKRKTKHYPERVLGREAVSHDCITVLSPHLRKTLSLLLENDAYDAIKIPIEEDYTEEIASALLIHHDNENKTWKKWKPGDQQPTLLEFGKGYWIYVNVADYAGTTGWLDHPTNTFAFSTSRIDQT
jgi:hypothetical protein